MAAVNRDRNPRRVPTFSAFSLNVAVLYERGAIGLALGYVLASVVLSIFALFAGLWLVRHLSW